MADYLRRLATTGAAYTAASVLSKIFAVALLPLYTSYVDSADYGIAELLFTSVVTASIVIRLGLIESLLRFFYLPDEDPDEVIRTGFAALFWLSTIAALVALPFAPQIGELLSDQVSADLVRISIGGLWLLTLYEYLISLFRLDERAKAYFAFTIAHVLVAIPLTVLLVVVGDEGARGLLLGSYASGIPFVIWFALSERRRLSLIPNRPLLRRMLRFGAPTMPAELSLYSLQVIDRVILVRYVGAAELGLYALAFKFSQAIQIVVRGFQLAWPPLAYSIRDDEEARRAYAVVLTAFTALCGFIVVGMWLEARWMVRLLAADEYFEAYKVIGPLSLGAALYGVYLALVVILGRTGRTDLSFPVTIVATISNVALNLALVPSHGIVGAGVALIASYLIVNVLLGLVTHRLFPIPWQWGRLTLVVGTAAALIAGGELLLPTSGAGGLLSRAALVALYPVILWFGGGVRSDERRAIVEAVRSGDLRERFARMRAGGSDGSRGDGGELYEAETRDADRGDF
jgi:O-antigen/teichoic acid export membrane protein